MTEAMEIELVTHVFERGGAVVDVFSPEKCTVDEFLNAYQSSKYDVFWVMSHGEFDHWSPKDVMLQIAKDRTFVSLEALWNKAPSTEHRRLLVLNVCDGARFEETGWLPKVGLAAGLAASEQATISHLWPVMAFPSATFGVYIAHHLVTGAPFFDAYQETLRAIRRTSRDIAADLTALYGSDFELIERLAVRDDDFTPIHISGSSAFFQ